MLAGFRSPGGLWSSTVTATSSRAGLMWCVLSSQWSTVTGNTTMCRSGCSQRASWASGAPRRPVGVLLAAERARCRDRSGRVQRRWGVGPRCKSSGRRERRDRGRQSEARRLSDSRNPAAVLGFAGARGRDSRRERWPPLWAEIVKSGPVTAPQLPPGLVPAEVPFGACWDRIPPGGSRCGLARRADGSWAVSPPGGRQREGPLPAWDETRFARLGRRRR